MFFSLPFEIVVVSALKSSQAGKFDGQGEMSSSCSVWVEVENIVSEGFEISFTPLMGTP